MQKHYWDAAAFFDEMGPKYDASLHARVNPSTSAIRKVIHDALERFVPREGWVLDLGCGTGDDALFLAKRGNHVMGLDLSAEMVGEAQNKVDTAGLHKNVRLAVAPVSHVSDVWKRNAVKGGKAIGGVSSFGVLNCEPEMDKVVRGLQEVMAPGSCLVATIMGRFSPWHLAGVLRFRDWRQTFARLFNGQADIGIGDEVLTIRYWFPREVAAMFESVFTVREIRPLGIVLPPPPRLGRFTGSSFIHGALERLDKGLGVCPLLRGVGDHFLIVLERRE